MRGMWLGDGSWLGGGVYRGRVARVTPEGNRRCGEGGVGGGVEERGEVRRVY